MSQTDPRRERVTKRIAASQSRLKRDNDSQSAKPRSKKLADAAPPENYRGLAAEYPLLVLAAGLGVGVLIAALLPKRITGKFAQRAMGAATVAAELGMSFSRQARDAAGEAAHYARDAAGDAAHYASDAAQGGLARLEETAAPLRNRADSAGKNARSQGARFATEALKLAGRLRR